MINEQFAFGTVYVLEHCEQSVHFQYFRLMVDVQLGRVLAFKYPFVHIGDTADTVFYFFYAECTAKADAEIACRKGAYS